MPQYRQLAAIMFTDIVGYTALMGDNEQNAFIILNKNRDIQRPLIEKHGGKWIKELGDGVIATFPTVTDAVISAVSIQQASSEVPGLKLRIGIHLSEVIFENHDVFGDGVNIAARIQSIAPAGGIWVSDAVQKNISNKKGIETKFIREERLKNVKDPVLIYEVDIASVQLSEVGVLFAPAEMVKKIAKKSIAVLPFTNLSGDPEQEYFSDGMAEEILNSLTHLQDLKVISRSSSFQFKGKNISLTEVGEKLGVATILEGSIRKQGNRVRITTQLVNSDDGVHLWSDRYDGDMDDIFAIQDKIALAITAKLKITLLEGEKLLMNKPIVNTEAYELYLKGRYYWNKRGRWLVNALQFFQQAIEIDPNLAKAYAGVADAYAALGLYGIIPPYEAMPKAKEAALKSIELNPSLNEPYTSMGFIYGIYENDRYLANKNFKYALELNPDYAAGHSWYSFYLSIVENDLAKAVEEGLKSTALEPNNSISYHITGLAFLAQKKCNEAFDQANKAIEIDATLFLPYFLAGWCCIETGNPAKAIEYLNTALNLSGRHSWALGFMTWAQASNGNMEGAKVLLDEIIERDKAQYFSVFGSVIGAVAVNNIDLALYFLEKGYKNKDILIHIFAHLTVMPENLRNDKRFLDFLRGIKLID
ncbi:MAG: adenylate/guanylate cyclase domain-containing protein [Ginsengibacter sp.]